MRMSLLIILLFPLGVQAQRLIIKNDRSKNKDSLIIYTAMPNRIMIYYAGDQADKSSYKRVSILKGDYDMYDTRYSGDTAMATLQVNRPSQLQLKLRIGNKDTLVAAYARPYLAFPYAALTRNKYSVFTRSELAAMKGISVFTDDNDFIHSFSVRSFTVNAVIEGQDLSVNVLGGYFSGDVRELFAICERNTMFHFKKISVTCPDCAILKVKDFSIKVL